ncbi:uncharacterized protein M6B38_280830 [Iris pallida]|uniref:Uncharacterized protein n=1 Tax=Iris pallida TaxID=29817 RepID=A0AAX6I1U5_IRIPA|nr:uncharacterized protein M6B38_280830 [Iris pallida]
MDFHSLTRRALQSLCKKNKIQANMTNVAMADALKALPAVEGLEEFQESQQLLSSKKEKKAPEPQGSPLPRSRRVTARAPQEVSKLAASEEEGKEEEKTAGASTTRRRTRRQPTTTTKDGDVDVGTRRTTRRRAASNMAALRAEEEEEEEEEEAEDVVENVVTSDQSTEGMETKEREGKQETNRMLPVVEQPKDVHKEEEEEEEAEFSDGGIQGVEKEHTVVLSEEEAAKFSNGGIQVVVEHTTVPNDQLGVEAAEMNAEISMIDQNRDSEEEEAAEMNAEISMVELSVDVPAAATDQTSQVGLVDPSDDGLSPAELVQGDGLSSGESEELAAEFAITEENEQSSNGDDADHAAAAADKFVEEESSEAAEISSKTNEEGPDGSYSTIGVPSDMGDFVDELGGDSAIDVPVEVEDLVPGHLTGEVAGEAATSPAKEVSMEEENKQSSNGDNTDHASAGGGDDHGFASEISDENEKADDAKEEETEQYNGEDTTTEEEELETTNDSGGGDSAIEVPVQIEDVVVSGLLVGEIAVEAATTPSSPVNIDPVPLSDDADNNNNKENENENADQPEPGRNGVDGLRKAKLENLSLRKLKAIYKDTLLVINKNKGEEKKRSALQALDENCLSLK